MRQRSENNLRGIDVSWYQGDIDWLKVATAGYSFAIIKATEGRTVTDGRFTANITGAKAAGIAVSAYHFFRARSVQEALQEASAFLNVIASVGGKDGLDFAPMLDIETGNGLNHTQLQACMKAWLEAVEQALGVKPTIYTYPYFIETFLQAEWLAEYKLHLADYNAPVSANGPWEDWTFLQYTDRGTVPGIAGPVDLNEFAGSVEDLIGFKLSEEDANYIIERWLAKEYEHASDADREQRHRLANELRKASGQPEQ